MLENYDYTRDAIGNKLTSSTTKAQKAYDYDADSGENVGVKLPKSKLIALIPTVQVSFFDKRETRDHSYKPDILVPNGSYINALEIARQELKKKMKK